MKYPRNPYPFVQDSCFSYFFGLNEPGLAGLIDLDSGDDILFGTELTLAPAVVALARSERRLPAP